MNKYNIYFHIKPPNMHRQNAAEWAIPILQNHFISLFSTTNPDCPISEWDRLIF